MENESTKEKKLKTKQLGYLQLAGAMSLAGSSVVVGKIIAHIPIFICQSISLFFALIVIIPFAIMKEGSFKEFKINRMDWLLILMQSIFGVFLFRVFMILGLRLTTATSSGIILSMTPAVLAVLSFFVLKEKIFKKTLIGISICIIGIIFINMKAGNISTNTAITSLLGNGFIFLSVVCESLFTIFRKKQSFSTKPLTTTSFIMLFAFILCLIVAIFQVKGYSMDQITIKEMSAFFFYGVACSALAYTLWFSGLAKVNVSEAAGLTCMLPLSSVLLSILILKETLMANHIFGLIFMLSGVYIIIMKVKIKESFF